VNYPKYLITALRLADEALYAIAKEAGDVPFWNRRGQGYRASEATRRALAKVDQKGAK
jgi:hypothetical protein